MHGEEECELILHGRHPGANSASFSTDGSRLVTTSGDRTAKIWDSCTGECLQTLHGHHQCVTAASFSPDCSRTVTASFDWTAKIWDTYSGECKQTLEGLRGNVDGHRGAVTSAMFSADGTLIVTASSFDGTVKIWDSYTGECKQTLKPGYPDELNGWAAFSMN